MAITVRKGFWSAVRGIFAGLFAQSTTNADDGVALQADEADGALHVKPIGDPDPLFQQYAEVTPIGAGGAFVTDWFDKSDWPVFGVLVKNTGANPITSLTWWFADNIAGTGAGGISVTANIPAGQTHEFTPPTCQSASTLVPYCPAPFIRLSAASTSGAAAVATFVGNKV